MESSCRNVLHGDDFSHVFPGQESSHQSTTTRQVRNSDTVQRTKTTSMLLSFCSLAAFLSLAYTPPETLSNF